MRYLVSLLVVLPAFVTTTIAQDSRPQSRPMGQTGGLDEASFARLHELREGEAPRLLGTDIEVGKAKAYLSLPKDKAPSAGVLVIHEWWGLNDHVKHWADRLAADGYAALAIDLYGGVVATTREAAQEARKAVDPQAALATLQAAHRFLAEDARVKARKRACIGWCFGGGWSLELAMAAPDLDAAVIYYGRLVTEKEKLAAIRAPILGVFGDQDQSIPPASIEAFAQAMREAGKPLTVKRYDAQHAFANPSSARYDKDNADKAWQEVRAFLKQHLVARVTGTFAAAERTFRYALPEGWGAGKDGPMRAASFTGGGATDCYVVALAGEGGGLVPNINRWRMQMGQKPLAADEAHALPQLDVLGAKATMVRIEGKFGEIESAVMLAVACPIEGSTLFVKMTGPAKEMAGQDAKFKEFCSSLVLE